MNRWVRVATSLFSSLLLAFLPATGGAAASAPTGARPALPAGTVTLSTVEGITEYRLANGLRVILFADAAKPTATVNVTYLVGSRHENHGETGMAHLLEHLIFKGSRNFANPTREFKARGFDINGSTWLDRTNYYLTFPASDDNIKWALAWSADAMVNSFIARKDLDTEMSVVRNEFEMGENDPASVMLKRTQSLLFDWHNYGNNTIGARSDIENVKIENLQAFYRKYYQPDNAVLTVAGKFDRRQVLAWVAGTFGKIPRPTRALGDAWTVEPTADGERQFVVRRKGEVQIVTLAYRTPSSLHDDSDGIGMASEILGDTPNGRLYRELVPTGLATQVFSYTMDTRDPGFVVFGAMVNKGQPLEPVRDRMIAVIEGGFAKEAASAAELQRAVDQSRTAYERALADPETFAVTLSEFIALGDWRLFFYGRDQLEKIGTAQVDAAAGKYLVRDNRVLGTFIPEDAPQRAEIPSTPTAARVLANYRARETGDAGESFDPSHDNIAQRSRLQAFGDLKLLLLPKKNRGQTVNVALSFRWGDEKSLQNRGMAGALTHAMLDRGTHRLSRQQLADEMTRLKMRGRLTHFETTRDKLPEALRLVAHILHDASFPAAEFEELKREQLTALQAQLDNPEALSNDALSSHFNTYPPGDPRYHGSLTERIERLRQLSLDDVTRYYRELVGTARGEIAIVGDFDAPAIASEIGALFPARVSGSPYARVDREFREVAPQRVLIDTPDKENAYLRARLDIRLRDDDADAAALYVANNIFGGQGGLSSRLIDRLRQQDGLSYSVGSTLSMSSRQRLSSWNVEIMAAPQNIARAEQAFLEELQRAQRDGFTDAEIAAAKKGIVEIRRIARSQDSAVAARWLSLLDQGRTWQFPKDFEARLLAATPAQINAAFRKYIAPRQLSVVVAGDGKRRTGH
ncbi:MAG TPA: pitrilysin family protein [Accumulibacter sp.]|jgi:zinc protease|nr:pitrilysin family protein [Accumulibacter sp.]